MRGFLSRILLYAAGFLFGIGATSAGLRIHDIRQSYANAAKQFAWVTELDRRRAAPIGLLLDLARTTGHVDGMDRLQLYLAVQAIDPIPSLSLQSTPIDFEIYERHQMRVSEKLSHVTQIAYGDQDILTASMLPAIQSRIEGTESAAMGQQATYNEAADAYEMLLRRWPNAGLAALCGLPSFHRLPHFAAFGESGPANQEWQLRDKNYTRRTDDDDD